MKEEKNKIITISGNYYLMVFSATNKLHSQPGVNYCFPFKTFVTGLLGNIHASTLL